MTHKQLQAFYSGKKVLVTGHTGFKGSWLSLWLEMMGAKVSGYALDPLTVSDNFILTELSGRMNDIRGDIRDLKRLTKFIQVLDPDIVFHLAAQALVLDSYQDPEKTFGTNVMGTVNVLEACRINEGKRAIIVITSDKCYENKEWIYPYRETDPIGGFDPYSASKGAAEIVCSSYRNSFFSENSKSLQSIASARAGNVIGGGDWAKNRIIPDLVKAIQTNETLVIRNPKAVRPWQHVLEPLLGYLQLGKACYEDKSFAQPWNFGPGIIGTYTVQDVVDKFIKYTGHGEWRVESDQVFHEAQILMLDISKAIQLLGWKSRLTFDDTIRLTAEWYSSYKKASSVTELCREQIRYFIEHETDTK